MGCAKKMKKFIKSLDLFSQKVGFRFDDEADYETFTGGLCSIFVIIAFVAIFTGTTINTFEKKNVSSVQSIYQETNPSYYEVGVDKFIFAIGLTGFNLNEGERWFDIYMQFRSYSTDERNKTYLKLVPCERSQWITVNSSLGEVYDRIGFDSWLCPENGSILQLQGKFTSEVFKFYKFAVTECSPTLDLSRPCVNSSEIEAYLEQEESFSFNFYFVNTIINGGKQQYLSYYLEDVNYFPFSPYQGVNVNLLMSTYTVTTDESIFPFQDIQNKTGGIVMDIAQVHNYEVKHDQYLKLYFRKSSQTVLVQRSFQKADDTLSYIGGLFSVILGILIIMSLFTQFSYQLQLAQNIYHYEKRKPLDSDGFHFFVYLGYLVYNIFLKFGISLLWQKMRTYHRSLEEVRKEFDIRMIMKKILFSQRVIFALLDEQKGQILHLQEPLTLEQGENIRKNHQFYERMKEVYELNEENEKVLSRNNDDKKGNISMVTQNQVIPEQLVETESKGKEKEKEKEKENFLQKQKEEMKKEVEKMKKYLQILEQQAKKGNIVSKRILEKFDKVIIAKVIHPQSIRESSFNLSFQNHTSN